MINNRLKKIAYYVEDKDNFIDVGCDHAFLSIYLVKNKKISKAIASDINIGPLNIATNNIKKYELEDIIKTKLGDGIEPIEEDINTIIISGMGGITISDIIKRGNNKLKNIKKIIASPNNEQYIVRKTINKFGYYITDEVIIKEKNKFYPIIVFAKGNKKYIEKELEFGPIFLKERPEEWTEFYNIQIKTLEEVISKLEDKTIKNKKRKEIKRLTEETSSFS